jgi:hypothetical protein
MLCYCHKLSSGGTIGTSALALARFDAHALYIDEASSQLTDLTLQTFHWTSQVRQKQCLIQILNAITYLVGRYPTLTSSFLFIDKKMSGKLFTSSHFLANSEVYVFMESTFWSGTI